MRTRWLACFSFVVAGSLAFACGGKSPPKEPVVAETVTDGGADDAGPAEPEAPKSLYERIGGKDGITKIVDSFVKNAQSNDATKKRFAKLSKDKLAKFSQSLVDQLCHEAGGDCEYQGKDMKSAHKGMKITEAEWTAWISAFKAAMDEHQVGETEQDDLIAILAPMRDDVVEVKPKGSKK